MLFFPYKANVALRRLPFITLAVCVLCIWVFARQMVSEHNYHQAITKYCDNEVSRNQHLVLRYLSVPPETHYCDLLLKIRAAPDHQAALHKLAEEAKMTPFYREKSDSTDYIYNELDDSFRNFEIAVPRNLTDKLNFDPKHPTFMSMLTAAFSHGSWSHVIFNLIFFFAFAASVEVITGYFYYLGFIALSAIGTHLAYRYSVAGVENALPTVGLSGVVMAMMAFLATIMPTLRIRCFLWFFLFFRIIRVPTMVIAGLYIAENLFDYFHHDAESLTNYVAHISGAAIGVAMGVVYRLRNRELLSDLSEEMADMGSVSLQYR